jgi:sugar phosphate isomerase/epimerase
MNTRRHFIKTAGLGLAAAAFASTASRASAQAGAAPAAKTRAGRAMRLGLASYTLRKFDYEEIVLPFMRRIGLAHAALKDFHLPLTASDGQIRAAVAKAKALGVTIYGCGVVYMKTPAAVERAFEYASTAGFDMIIGAPNVDLLPLAEKKVKETNVKLAIHNHGPDNPLYSSPLDAHALIKDMDARMGLCIDIGHVQRLAQDPVAVFNATVDRVLDVHIKDVSASSKAGKTVEVGRGVIDIPAFLRTVVAHDYAGVLGFEHEKDPDDPFAGLAESIGHTRGVLNAIGSAWC